MLCRELKEFLSTNDISPKDFAGITNVSLPTVYYLLKGKKIMQDATYRKVRSSLDKLKEQLEPSYRSNIKTSKVENTNFQEDVLLKVPGFLELAAELTARAKQLGMVASIQLIQASQ